MYVQRVTDSRGPGIRSSLRCVQKRLRSCTRCCPYTTCFHRWEQSRPSTLCICARRPARSCVQRTITCKAGTRTPPAAFRARASAVSRDASQRAQWGHYDALDGNDPESVFRGQHPGYDDRQRRLHRRDISKLVHGRRQQRGYTTSGKYTGAVVEGHGYVRVPVCAPCAGPM